MTSQFWYVLMITLLINIIPQIDKIILMMIAKTINGHTPILFVKMIGLGLAWVFTTKAAMTVQTRSTEKHCISCYIMRYKQHKYFQFPKML